MIRQAPLTLTWMLIAASVTPLAYGQTPRRQSIADRMAAFGRSWIGSDQAPSRASQNEGRDVPGGAPSTMRNAPASRGALPQIDARSLLPTSLFGDDDRPQATTVPPPSMTRGRAEPRVQDGDTAPRAASRPRMGSVQSHEPLQENFTLPGLGGSRLPLGAIAPESAPHTASSQRADASREIADDSLGRRTERKIGAAMPTNVVAAAGRAPINSDRPSAGAGPRQSPQRHAPMHVDPEELRRELAGAFPISPTADTNAQPKALAAETSASIEPEPAEPAKVSPATSQNPVPDDHAVATIVETGTQSINIPSQSTDTPFTLPTSASSDSSLPAREIAVTPAPTATRPLVQKPIGGARNSQVQRSVSDSVRSAVPSSEHSGISIDFNRSQPAVSPNVSAASAASSISAATRSREAFGEAGPIPTGDASVLVSHQTPVIATDIRGPKQILVGQEATYRVRLQNQGQVAAEGIVANVRIPSGADIINTTTTHGTIQQAQEAGAAGNLEWQLTRLEAGAHETLDIRLVPRTSRPLELGVSWTRAPIGSRAVVEVQEPKLQLHVTGPDEVLFGKPQLYRLTLSNPGTGAADGVKIDLMPPGGGDDAVTSHPIGSLAAGASQTIEVELTAREAGKLFVKAIATGDGGLTSDAAKEIFCRKPELEVDWRGPETKYTDTEATHFVRVRNPGTAPAENVSVVVALPAGAELVSASDGKTFDASRGELTWRVGTLGPGDDYYMELKCRVTTPGKNEMKITASTAAGDLADTHVATTNVVALADLKLEVTDPQGPIALGDEAVYEIRVQNRGQGAAQDVSIVALFSDGVEPTTVEGAMYSVSDGRVSFRTIDDLPPGKQVVLRIRANAKQAGNHVFRAEVLCRDLDIKLAAEETTRFYADEVFDNDLSAGNETATSAESTQPTEPSAGPVADVGDRYQVETR